MKFIKYLILFFIMLMCISCESYSINPIVKKQDLHNDYSQLILNCRFHYLYLQSKKLNIPLTNSIKKIKFKEIKEINTPNNKGLFLEIKIRYLEPFGIGIGILTAITLGIIPTYIAEHDMHGIKFQLYNNSKLLYEKEYIIRMKQFNWIFVAPAWLVNVHKRNEAIDSMTQDFFSGIDFKNMK